MAGSYQNGGAIGGLAAGKILFKSVNYLYEIAISYCLYLQKKTLLLVVLGIFFKEKKPPVSKKIKDSVRQSLSESPY